MKAFLRWWIIFTLIVVGSILTQWLGFIDYTLENDASYLSASTYILFILTSIYLGKQQWFLSCKNHNKVSLKRFEEVAWFISDQCLNLGLLGTLIGFLMMLSGFQGLNIADSSTIQALLANMGRSMGTALLTTVWGLACGMLLKLQLVNFSIELDKERN